jgi:hypothetical protein
VPTPSQPHSRLDAFIYCHTHSWCDQSTLSAQCCTSCSIASTSHREGKSLIISSLPRYICRSRRCRRCVATATGVDAPQPHLHTQQLQWSAQHSLCWQCHGLSRTPVRYATDFHGVSSSFKMLALSLQCPISEVLSWHNVGDGRWAMGDSIVFQGVRWSSRRSFPFGAFLPPFALAENVMPSRLARDEHHVFPSPFLTSNNRKWASAVPGGLMSCHCSTSCRCLHVLVLPHPLFTFCQTCPSLFHFHFHFHLHLHFFNLNASSSLYMLSMLLYPHLLSPYPFHSFLIS